MSYSTDDIQEAYEKGYQAALRGRSVDANPYRESTVGTILGLATGAALFYEDKRELAEAWEEGFRDGLDYRGQGDA